MYYFAFVFIEIIIPFMHITQMIFLQITRKSEVKPMVVKVLNPLLIFIACISFTVNQASAQTPQSGPVLEQRWFFAFGFERTRQGLEQIEALVDTAAVHGLNGMVLSSFGLDSITRWKPEDVALLKELAAHCAEKKIELIPTGFSAGYGGGALDYDRNFAAALPVIVRLKAHAGKLVPEVGKNLLANGDMEKHEGDSFPGFALQDQPGKVSFADPLAAGGKTSIRFENFGASQDGHGRLMQTVHVVPGKAYRFSMKLKTQDLAPASGITLQALVNGRFMASVNPPVKPTQDWTEAALDFISSREEDVSLYAGIWGGKSGKFWLDDLRFVEYNTLADIVRRDGTPLELKSRDRAKVFAEGRDFEVITCREELNSVPIPKGSSIREGEKLELSCYEIPFVAHSWGKQMSLCMSNPPLYKYWDDQARRLHEIFPYKRFLLAMDEIRNGGGCLLCKNRGISMAEILGDCITRQREIFKAIDPSIEVLIWSDMLDPAHNAHNNYYGVVGDYNGSWKYIPKDITIMCWWYDKRDISLPFFSGLGFRTFGAAYYDADDLANPRDWLASLCNTPRAEGIMYTTWENKYTLLAGYGDLVSGGK